MNFDPQILWKIRSENQEDLDRLFQFLAYLHSNPQFIFQLFQDFERDELDNYLRELLAIEVKNSLRMHWLEDNFWSDQEKKLIISNLFSMIEIAPTKIKWNTAYIFDAIVCKKLSELWWSELLINRIKCADDNLKPYLIYIALNIIKAHNKERKLFTDELDSVLCELFQSYMYCFDAYLQNSMNDENDCLASIFIIKSFRYLLKNSAIITTIQDIEQLSRSISQVLFIKNPSKSFVSFQYQVIRTFQTMVTEFYGSQSKSYIFANQNRYEYAMQFKNNVILIIIQVIKTIMNDIECPKISNAIAFFIYQLAFYQIDESLLSLDLLEFIINRCTLSDADFEEILINPIAFKEQQMDFVVGLDKNLPRSSCACLIQILDDSHPDIINNLIPNDTDQFQVIDSKLFLLSAIIQRRQSDEIEIPAEIYEKLIEICSECMKTTCIPLILSAFKLYSLIIPVCNPLDGIQECENLLVNDSTLEIPLIGVFASKIMRKCIENSEVQPMINVPIVLDAVINLMNLLKSREFYKLIQCICKEYSQFVIPYLEEIFHIFIEEAYTEEIVDDHSASLIENSLETIENLISCFTSDNDILMEIFKLTMRDFITILYNSDEGYPYGSLFNIIGLFSQNITSDMQDMYDAFVAIVNSILTDTSKSETILEMYSKQFTLYVYPLFSERESEFVETEPVQTAFQNMCEIWYQLISSASEDTINSGFYTETIRNFIFMLNVGIQAYPENPLLESLLVEYQ
ncbi:hypothetical protein TVAG_402910 [Trichomonas vaginalis G3]|uniref:Importin N-terminal domain-containing protein n=1 Tax=Trichomonas vaginalis (strain ATCC PRA-98 / G3) TaxID=412133 RepID=A2G7S5_TRIV3|nr:armadillo (ARM) repeat-containing protein family [Trichomonas vaginalis G3]EAX86792.1 hypothetical protein TVAG_402910 [Trichomonas vaginalis G3]KAI5526495.1 armadillo (ARM) repeat-containing protein family [Trichomonas vaginalis G3]|eukprot:XP_001299722.1 hypothetical protein [Trichomonas vaginalis G3]